jgi:septal ring factor EnvC (AmiA/AmiB activator)
METLKQLFIDGWPVMAAAPIPAFIVMAAAAIAAWWFRGKIVIGEITALNARIGALEERLRLAADKFQSAEDEKKRLETSLQELKRQIEAGAPKYALTNSSASAETHMIVLGRLLGDLRTTIVPTEGVTFMLPPKSTERR